MPPLTNNDLGLNKFIGLERAIDALTRATLAASQSKVVDANGWTVYDYGSHKAYRKRVTINQAINGPVAVTLSSSNLPTGMATLGSNFISGSKTLTGSSYGLNWGFEMSSASASLNITGSSNNGLITFTGWFDIEIITI